MSDSDGETGAKSQRTSGSFSLQGQSTTSPPPKCSRRAERANLNIDAALDPDNYEEMDIPSLSFKTFIACAVLPRRRVLRKSTRLTNHQHTRDGSNNVTS